MRRKLLAAVGLAAVALAAFASPAGAASGDGSLRTDRRISVTGGVKVAEGEVVNGPVVSVDGPAIINGTVKDVYVGNGRLDIGGQVTGDVLVVHGDVFITGRVGGDVVALDGRITTRDGARVNGDVKSRNAPNVAPGTVGGHVRTLNIGNLLSGFLIVFLIVLWIAVTVSVGILGLLFVLLFPRAADATAAAGRRFWPTLGWGALIGIAGPILGVLVFATIVGIPFGLGVLSALNVLAPLGYVASSLILGRLMVKGTSTGGRIGAFFAGFGILRAAALIPAIGLIVWFLACIYGLGALTRAAWRAGRRAPEAPATEPLPEAPPEPEPPTLSENTVPAATGAPASAEPQADEAPPPRAPD
jgi:cytoskeletal protein CcmA (bactofilin family)